MGLCFPQISIRKRFNKVDNKSTMCRYVSLVTTLVFASITVCVAGVTPLDFDYHNYTELTAYLRAVTAQHADLSQLHSIGKSVKGRELWVVELSAAKEPRLGVPNVKLIGNIHGNEATGKEVLLHLIEFLVTSYPSDDTVRWLLENTRIHILPSLNPDGFEIANPIWCQGEMLEGRNNANGLDLNRNFRDQFYNHTREPQPEMTAIVKWLQTKQFVLSASFHGGALVANYPYDSSIHNGDGLHYPESLTPDNDVFRHLALTYSKTHPTMHLGKPCPRGKKKFEDGITNGASWYPSTGGMQDYNYWMSGCMEITVEIGCCKYPFPHELPQIWMENKQALLKFISQAHRGVRGVIRDNRTQLPISGAKLNVNDRTVNFQSNGQGEFWRILLPGNYQLEVHKTGYEPAMLPFTVDEEREDERFSQSWLDVFMHPSPPPGASPQVMLQMTGLNTSTAAATTTTTTTTTTTQSSASADTAAASTPEGSTEQSSTNNGRESNDIRSNSSSLKLEASTMKSCGVGIHSSILLFAVGVFAFA